MDFGSRCPGLVLGCWAAELLDEPKNALWCGRSGAL